MAPSGAIVHFGENKMNVGRLHAALEAVKNEIIDDDVIKRLSELRGSLQQSVNQPNPDTAKLFKERYQETLEILYNAKSNLATPTRRMIYDEIHASNYLGLGLLKKLEVIFNSNQIVPANAIVELDDLIKDESNYIRSVQILIEQFENLDIEYDALDNGEFEGGFSIPREVIKSDLESLSKEFNKIDNFIKTIKEIVGDEPTSANVKIISSSEWQIFIDHIPEAAACTALAIERIVALYKNHLEIKKLKEEMENKNLPDQITSPMQDYIDNLVNEKLRELSEDIVNVYYTSDDEGRKNELKTKLTQDLKYVAHRIDHGSTFEVSAELPLKPEIENEDEESAQEILKKHKELMEKAKFIEEKTAELSKLQKSTEPTLMLSDETQDSD